VEDAAAVFVRELTRCQRALCAYLCALTGSLVEAEEILQEVNARLWEQKERYDPSRQFLPWARTVAHYQVLAYRTRKRRDRWDFDEQVLAALASEAAEMGDELEARHRLLERCLGKLGHPGRHLLDLCYAGGLAIKTAAARLGRSEAGTYKALARIRQKLHDCVAGALERGRAV